MGPGVYQVSLGSLGRGRNLRVQLFWASLPWLITMAILICCSAFFSASEAALFSLRGRERRSMARGSTGERMAERLLRNPDRLLSAVLFWNLLVNILYFAIATMVGASWEAHPTAAGLFAAGSLIAIIFFSEMLPKSLGVLSPRSAAAFVSVPMAMAVRVLDPIMPALRTINVLSQRLIWPGLEEHPRLEFRDLERAVELSQVDDGRGEKEKTLLQNIVQLSDLETREWMRPRKVIRAFSPPVSLADLRGVDIPSGYLLITGDDDDEIEKSLDLSELTGTGLDRLDRMARPVVFVPWCTSIGDTLEALYRGGAQAASVVNERGESVGIITLRDIFDAVLTKDPHRAERLLNRHPLETLEDGTWQVDGMTNVRRLEELVEEPLPTSRNVTLGGVVQETLEHFPQAGDHCTWGPVRDPGAECERVAGSCAASCSARG